MKTSIQKRLFYISTSIPDNNHIYRMGTWAREFAVQLTQSPDDIINDDYLNNILNEDNLRAFVTAMLSIIDRSFLDVEYFHLIPKLDELFKYFYDRMSIPEINLFETMKDRLILLRDVNKLKAVRQALVLSEAEAEPIVLGEEPHLTPPGRYLGEGTEDWGNQLKGGPQQ